MRKKDIVLLAVIILLAILYIAFALIFNDSRGKAFACVYIEDKLTAKYSLDQNCEHIISGINGTNTLVIEDGRAFISDATCPDHVCVNTGALDKDDNIKTIVCLPNKVMICIEYE